MNNWTVVEVLRHARHDWMNKLQLIKGNLALNKIDQVERLVNEIVMEAKQETKLSNLKLPKFAEILLTFNWERHPFHIEYEIMDESCSWPVDDEKLSGWITAFFETLENCVASFADNHLTISIDLQDKNIRFFFDFSGTINNKQTIEDWFAEQEAILKVVKVDEISIERLNAEVIL
ncbi:sporulation initiation phosphotransferase B [Bacillus sp. FJAT-49736]|uniref:sporulation initiation phosphotransferase B n=1 Tax=Bacillus sp. FJAT-49736 TaxID=2833582 RepID=UPI001BC9B574|nr:sporulation initiation phosphotransferase B [Bacillus sp. FJAT-49736]MBS4173689.1 sporulation initiation phosphotransferase B [Bacillus sp. FJAT-49736]